ncbi:MAG: hypothetical protein M1504_02025 [Candidatus Marsarchaeota archaeon]|nr:hypothetical protein [Candidatus Marsarchaeota archaeon]
MPKEAQATVQPIRLPEPISRDTFTLPNGEKYLKLRYYWPGEEPTGLTRDQTREIAAKEKLPMIPIEEALAIMGNDQLRTAMESNLKKGDLTYVGAPKTDTQFRVAYLYCSISGRLNVVDYGIKSGDVASLVVLKMGCEVATPKIAGVLRKGQTLVARSVDGKVVQRTTFEADTTIEVEE